MLITMGYLDNGVLYNNAGQRVPNNWLNRKVYLGKKGSNGTTSGIESFFENVFNGIRSWFVGKTGQALTGAEQQANEFAHNEAQLAFDRELEASNTAYQRKVADLLAAGINPMMAASSGVSLPSSSAASSVSPSAGTFQLAELLNLYRMKQLLPLEKAAASANIENTKADTEFKHADAEAKRHEAESKRILNKYLERSEELRLEGNQIANNLDRVRTSEVYKHLDVMAEQQNLLAKQAETEVERKAATEAEKILKRASAHQIVALLPFEQEYKSASSEAARNAALLSAVNAAYQNKLITDGYIEAQLRSLDVNASGAELKNAEQAVKTAFRTGKLPEGYEDLFNNTDKWTLKNILMPFNNVLENLNPLAGIIKVGASL